MQRLFVDLRLQILVLIAASAAGIAANVGLQVGSGEHFATLEARREAIGEIEAAARRAEVEAAMRAFEGSPERGPLEARLREVDLGLTALRTGDEARGIPAAPASAAPAVEQAQLIWARERARLLQAAGSVSALRTSLDDGTSREFLRAMRAVDARFDAAGSGSATLLRYATLVANVLSGGVALAAGAALLRYISGPLRRLEGLTKEIEGGNIWARFGAPYPPGMAGNLARAFDEMVDSLGNKAQLERDALTDELTGLPNRRAFFMHLEAVVQEAERSGGTFDVCFVDVDEFKTINDQFGHHEGDIALQDVAHVLRHRFGESSVIGRLGGDEFAVIYAGAERLSTDGVSTELALLLAELADTEERVCAVEVSVGVSAYSRGDTADTIVQRADRSMYGEKRARSEARARRRNSAA